MLTYLRHMNAHIPTHHTELEEQLKSMALEITGREIEFTVMVNGDDSPEQSMERQLQAGEAAVELELLLRYEEDVDKLGLYASTSIQALRGAILEPNHLLLKNFAGSKIQLKAFQNGPNDYETFIRASSSDLPSCYVAVSTNDDLIGMTAMEMIAQATEQLD